ncbi:MULTISPECIES: metal-dependent hydrolase [unclassified Haladaptatus]|uniref:metal-dependent hydrolase n=1 Tax=unclassified Haladaptatus TaxID=2622732 RepID=UPI0023E76359|nr:MULTISPECIES: metal-dependent hydrolase [unclassified Haladaptatus]
MPSTVVHLALAGLLAAGLLGDAFDRRALAVVLGVTIIPDLDVFAGFFVDGGHRSVLHTFLIPLAAAGVVYLDTRRESSWLAERWGRRGVRVAWVSIVAFAVAGIGLDLFTAGANVFYPVHDQFYRVSGELIYSTNRGLVQTFVDFSTGSPDPGAIGSSSEVHVNSGIDPNRGAEPEGVDRIFPVAQSGWQLLLIVTSCIVLWGRLREEPKV